jgi:glyoxylase-like metal-dependent hydrolase (beta-lactamase superfamily II)
MVQGFDPQVGIPELPDWAVIHTPGHTPGHLSLYRRRDGVLITGDAVVTVDLNSLLGVLFKRPGAVTPALQHVGLGRGTAVHRHFGRPRAWGPCHCPWSGMG